MTSDRDTRDELITALQELSAAMPDMRFGQLIINLSYFAREPSDSATWDVEDDELLAAARRLLARQRHAHSPDPVPATAGGTP